MISASAGLNSANDRLMLVNKDSNNTMAVNLDIKNFNTSNATLYRYSAANFSGMVSAPLPLDQHRPVTPPAYSISLLGSRRTRYDHL